MKPGTRQSAVVSRHAVITVLALVGTVMLAGCDKLPFGYTKVNEIVVAPARFEGKEVKLKGKVRTTLWVLKFKSYTLRDPTGEITVVTQGTLPEKNSEVAIKGVVKSAVILSGAYVIGLRVEETKRLR
ncbi:MAG: hypothetical protein A3I02_00800 [Betaproteobacteria bacterium RIFCSPLOWO2_02_FULL_67_26]|nr:MAG: hypothetical protein A3I02_00800 [Betaproteobacteria bacterium RIFCSPLOWO2_02_FULL_67_26]